MCVVDWTDSAVELMMYKGHHGAPTREGSREVEEVILSLIAWIQSMSLVLNVGEACALRADQSQPEKDQSRDDSRILTVNTNIEILDCLD